MQVGGSCHRAGNFKRQAVGPPTARYRRKSAASARNGAATKTTTASSMRRTMPTASPYPLASGNCPQSSEAGSEQDTREQKRDQ
jgi:hypothetical protein